MTANAQSAPFAEGTVRHRPGANALIISRASRCIGATCCDGDPKVRYPEADSFPDDLILLKLSLDREMTMLLMKNTSVDFERE
jgi:hypothetical protein